MEQAKKIASYKVTADSGGRAVFFAANTADITTEKHIIKARFFWLPLEK